MRGADVVVTGVGLLTAHGFDPAALDAALAEGRAPLSPVDAPAQDLGPGVAARVDLGWESLRTLPGARPLRPATMTRYTALAVGATGLALADGAVSLDDAVLGEEGAARRGVHLGSYVNIPPIDKYVRLALALADRRRAEEGAWAAEYARFGAELKRFSGFEFLSLMNSMPSAHATIQGRCMGPIQTFIGTAAAGLQAMGGAAEVLADGDADLMLAGGLGSGVNQSVLLVRNHSGHLAPPGSVSGTGGLPFDVDAPGMVPAEGAAVLVMERREAALARGAAPLARVAGWATAWGVPEAPRRPSRDPSALARAIEGAARAAGEPRIDAVFATGSGWAPLDALEWEALRQALGPQLGGARLACHTAATGFLEAAHGAVGAGLAVRVLAGRCALPPPPRPARPLPGLEEALSAAEDRPVRHALVVAAAPEGAHAALVLAVA